MRVYKTRTDTTAAAISPPEVCSSTIRSRIPGEPGCVSTRSLAKRSANPLSLRWQSADPVELFGTASVFRDRLMDADERTIPAQPSDHRVEVG